MAKGGVVKEAQSKQGAITWRRGFHRIFAACCVVWALFVMLGIPLQQANQAQGMAAAMVRQEIASPAATREIAEARKKIEDNFWAQGSVSYQFRTAVLPNLHWFLLLVVAPPALLYALAYGAATLFGWLYRGFKTPD